MSARSLRTPYGPSPMRAPSDKADGYYAADLAALQLQEGWVIHLHVSRNRKTGKWKDTGIHLGCLLLLHLRPLLHPALFMGWQSVHPLAWPLFCLSG